jgi:hypothetical protein
VTREGTRGASHGDRQLHDTADEAYVYGYPLLIAATTCRVMSAPGPGREPFNHFRFLRKPSEASFTEVVSPNTDTLYASAWLDLDAEPMVLSLPDFGDASG